MQPLHNALTPPTVVLAGLRQRISAAVPNLSFVFDPTLDWSEAAKAQRAQRAMQMGTVEEGSIPDQGSEPTQYPLMAWNRSTLIPMAGRSRRNAFNGYSESVAGSGTWDLQAFFGELTFAFKIYSRDILELEALEMGYVAQSLISDITGFDIPVEALSPAPDANSLPPELLRYDTQWDPLDPMILVERLPVMAFAIQGTAMIRGAFLTGSRTPLYPIQTIDCDIRGFQGQELEHVVVHR